MLLRVRVIPVARFYVSVGRTLRSVGSSGFALRLEKALQGAIANESNEGANRQLACVVAGEAPERGPVARLAR